MGATALATLLAGSRVERTGRYRVWPIAGSISMAVGLAFLATVFLGTSRSVVALFGAVVGTDDADALPAVFLTAVPLAILSLVAALGLEEHPLGEHARFALDMAG